MQYLKNILKWMLYPFMRRIVRMPGRSHSGALPPLGDAEREIKAELESHVHNLAKGIGERNVRSGLEEGFQYVSSNLAKLGFPTSVHEFVLDGVTYKNVEVEIKGASRAHEIVVVGAHYDTVFGSPGADDNATGVAALLEIARLLKAGKFERTVRFVFFANEEHPLHTSECMGSFFYAQRCRQANDNIVGMLSLEMLGIYSDADNSQAYPPPFSYFYPTRGNFIAFVGNTGSRALVHKCIGSFRRHTAFPSEGAAAPEMVKDIGRSDHWGFWKFGYQALMITDTSNFRFKEYHTPDDTPDKLNFDCFARVTAGLARTVRELATDR